MRSRSNHINLRSVLHMAGACISHRLPAMLAVVMLQFFWQAAFGQIVENAASDSTAYLDAELLVREPPADSYDEAADTVQTVVTADNLPYALQGRKSLTRRPTGRCGCRRCFPGSGRSTTGATGNSLLSWVVLWGLDMPRTGITAS